MYNPENYSTISFPGLGLKFNPDRIIDLGFMQFRWYGLIIAVGLLLAVIYGLRRSKKFGLLEDDIIDGVLWIVPVAIVCARLLYCICEWQSYKHDPISVLYIWQGGLTITGGVVGALLGVLVFCRVKKISAGAVLDLVALGFLIGQCIGRWGNFFNREAFGSEITSNFFLRMGLEHINTGVVTYFHPTFLYESLWNLVGFIGLHFLSKKRKYDGQIALSYAGWYGFGRALIEGLRVDSLPMGPFRFNQLVWAVGCAAAVAVLLWQWLRNGQHTLYVDKMETIWAEQAAAEETAEETAEAAAEEQPEEETE